MREIGVRELKSGLSEVLREIDAGASVRVTVRGRPVADLVPVDRATGDDDPFARMAAAGRLTRARPGPRPPAPVRAPGGPGPSASDIVIADRDRERDRR